MLYHYFKIALRHLLRQKTISAINVLGLSAGMACCILLFLYVKDELTHDRFHEKSGSIYRVTCSENDGARMEAVTGPPVGPALAADLPEIEYMVRLTAGYNIYRIGNQSFTDRTLLADKDFFNMFSFKILKGDAETALIDENSVVLSQSTAAKYFGSENPIGQAILMENGKEFISLKVSAVAEDAPENSSITYNVVRNLTSVERSNDPTRWLDMYINTFISLHSGTNPSELERKFPAVVEKYAGERIREINAEYGDKFFLTLYLQPLTDIHLNPQIGAFNGLKEAGNPIYAYVLVGIGIFILLLACINFINLSLARSLPRAKEIGLRKVVGAGKGQLRRQFLGEALLLCAVAILLGFIIAEFSIPFFNDATGKKLSLNLFQEWELSVFVVLLLLSTALLAGFYPSVILSGMDAVKVLKGKQKISGKGGLGKSMIVLQFSIAVFLMITAMGMSRQVNFMLNKDLGYDPDNLLRLEIPSQDWERNLEVLKTGLEQEPEFVSIGGSFAGTNRSRIDVGTDQYTTYHSKVGYDYMETMRIPLIEGRNFKREMATDTASVIVNQTFVRMMNWEEPIGRQFNFWDSKLTVVGVIADYHFLSLHQEMPAMMWHRLPQMDVTQVNCRIVPGMEQAAIKKLEAFWHSKFPYRPFDFRFVADINKEVYDKEMNWQYIIRASSGLAVLIAFTGLFGLASLTIKERTKEIGVRKVLGASLSSLAWLLTSQFNRLVLLGVVVAIPLGLYVLDIWLQNFAYRISPGAAIFIIAALATLAGTAATILYQSLKVARANPAEALRYE